MNTRISRILALVLACVMLIGLFPATVLSVGAEEVSIQNGTGSRGPVRVGKTLSYRAIVNTSFTGFAFTMPTWTRPDSVCTLSLYKWAGTFDKTVAGTPIASKVFDPMTDGAKHWVEFDEQPAGEYLFHVSDPKGEVGVWTNTSPTNSKGFFYENGLEGRGEPELHIRLTEASADPFGVCQPSGDIRVTQLATQGGTGEGVTNISSAYGLRLNTAAPFVGAEFKMATYMSPDYMITVSVWNWKGTYAKTIESTPAATGSFVMVDNAFQGITFDELPAGDYLILAHNPQGGPAMYHFADVTGFEGVVYQDGYPSDPSMTVYPECRLTFTEELTDKPYFLPCEDAEDAVTGDHVAPPEYVIPEDSLIYTHPVMPDTWVFTDGLGRVSLTNAEVGDPKEDKTLAMFYWSWHIDGFVGQVPNNLQQLSEQHPDAMNDWDNPLWSTLGGVHFWNEPIYGYYRSDDQWVARRQAELLANAGVDVVFTDNTNSTLTWRNAYTPIMNAWTEAQKDGLNVPKFSFMLPFSASDDSKQQLQSIYLDVFRSGKWQNLWYYLDGKPMMMAHSSNLSANSSATEKEILNFFTFRSNYPGYQYSGRTGYGEWGWLSIYPQAVYYANREAFSAKEAEQITVGIAMNHNYEKGALDAMNGQNIMGRSYTSKGYHTEPDAKLWGYNFAEQFEYALKIDPKVVFVTGWNEFRVGRYESWGCGTENAFPDTFNDEYSRDIEPSKGDLKDHYYYQLVNFVRQYKGANPIPTPSKKVTIDLGDIGAWKQVEPYYGAYIGNTDDRNAQGYGDLVYTETSGRNDIIGAQVARDDEYVYFHVECAEQITPYTDKLWMNLYIDSDQENQGWNTFEYVLNKSAASQNTLVLEKFTAENDYTKTEKVADVEYKVSGRYMTVKIAKSDLGLTGDNYTINFAWTDNVHDEGNYDAYSGDIMDFYISGDVAPGGRFKYSFISTSENAGSDEVTPPESETTPDTDAPDTDVPDTNEPDTSAPDTNKPEDTVADSTAETAGETKAPDKGGCGSVIGVSMAVLALAMGAAVVLRKKEE